MEVKNLVKSHFENNLSENETCRPLLDGIPFRSRFQSDNELLTALFTTGEIREAVWSCDGNKSPGTDDFNFAFFKSCWDVLESDIVRFLSEFHNYVVLPRSVTALFISLVPKTNSPQSLFEYRSILLVGS